MTWLLIFKRIKVKNTAYKREILFNAHKFIEFLVHSSIFFYSNKSAISKNLLTYIHMYLMTINSVEGSAMLFYRNEIGKLYDDILVGKVFRIV